MTADEIKLGFLLLQHLRVATRERSVHKFNVIGRSTKGESRVGWVATSLHSRSSRSFGYGTNSNGRD